MRQLNMRNKFVVTMVVVLSMLAQIVGPVVGNFVYAGDVGGFRIVNYEIENETANIDWALTLKSDDKSNEYSYNADFNLEEEESEKPLKTNDGTVIGEYKISKEGKITVEIYEEVYKVFDKVDLEDPEESEEDEVEPDESEDDEVEAEETEETEEKDGFIGKVLGFVASMSDIDDLFLGKEEIDEPAKTFTFFGNFEVEGAKKKPTMMKMLMGLLGGGPEDLGDIFTDVKLIIDGKEVGDDQGIVNLDEITESMTIGLEFGWRLPDNGDDFQLNKGDWGSIQLPAVFKGVIGYMNGPLKDGIRTVGRYEISEDGILKVEFKNDIEFDEGFLTEKDRKGTVGFILDFVLDPFYDNSVQEIEFGAPINKTFIIKVKPSGTLASISKSGGPNKVPNADAIDWVIDVNTSLESLTNAIIKDSIPEGLELEGNIEVYNLKVGINESLTQGDLKETIISTDPRNLEVVLGVIDTAYRIKYTTKITDYSKPAYTNKAELYDGSEKKADSTVTVDKVEQGAAISKKSITPDKNAKLIKWEIDVNKGQETLQNVIIEDVLQENLRVKADTIKIFELNMVDGSWIKGDEVISSFTPTFPLSLGNLGISDVYRIEFETDIEYTDYKETNTFINKAILKADKEVGGNVVSEQVGESTASATVYRDPIIIKEGKEITSYDSEYPIIEWEIKINGASHHIYGAVLTDTIGSGLELTSDPIKIYDSSNNEVTIQTDEDKYPRILSNINNIMKIGFGDINSSYTIKYQTKIISIDENTFKNEAKLTGTGKHGIGPGGTEVIYDVEKNVIVPPGIVNNSYSKKAVSIDYSYKTMTWQIEIDAVKEALTGLTIVDTFEDKYMVFIEDGFSVTKGSATLAKDTDYTVTNNNVTGFVLVLKESAFGKGKYVITYKTSFDPNTIIVLGGTPKAGGDNIYKNKVKLTGTLKESVGVGTKTLDVDLVDAHTLSQDIYNVGKKEGKLDREKKEITWRIYVNAQSRNLTGSEFKVTDTIGDGHSFKADSLTVREFTLKPGGILSVDDVVNGITLGDLVDPSKYSLVTLSNPFTLTFSEGINKAYLIEYATEIKGITQPNYTNSAKIDDKSGERTYPASVYYKDHNVFVSKEALNAKGGKVYADDELNWKAVVNESLSEINNAEFIDTISTGHVYVDDSLKVYKGTKEEGILLSEDTSADADANKYKLGVTSNGDGITSIKVELGNIKGRYTITYDTAVISSTGVITNTATLKGTLFSEESTGIKKFNITKTSWGTGSGVSELRGAIKIKKVDNASSPEPVKGAKFKLFYKVNATDAKWHAIDETFLTGTDGTITIGNLPKGRTYKLVELAPPTGYKMKTDEADYTREIIVVANTTTEAPDPIINERIRDITVKKVWIGPGKDGKKAKEDGMKVEFTLKGKVDGVDIDLTSITPIELNGTPNWEGKFEGLDYYDSSGKEIEYSVVEKIIYPDSYDKTPMYELLTENPVKSTPVEYGNFTLTFNNKNMEKISLPVEKVWRKDDTTTPPFPVTIKLVQDNSETITLNDGNV